MKTAPSLPTRYKLTAADPVEHLLPISHIISDQYGGGEHVKEISEQYVGNCHYDFDVTRLIWEGKALIHHWGVWGYHTRVGGALLKTAGIGAVVTRAAYRNQGLMHAAALESFQAMRDYGYDLSVLRGRHYVKYGYARGWNYVTYRLTEKEVPSLSIQKPYQLLTPAHVDELGQFYNRDHEQFSGTAVRPTYRRVEAGDMFVYGWFEDGKLAGYVRALPAEEKKSLQCLEAAGDVDQGLAVLADLYKQGGYETLTFFTMHHQHPMLKRLRRGACVVENKYFDITGWRVKLINLHSTLEKLKPLLEQRLQESRYQCWSGEFFLDAGEQKASLAIEKGTVQILDGQHGANGLHAGDAAGRFLIGSEVAEEIIQQEGIRCEGKTLELADILFPNLSPMLSHWDEY